MDIKKYEVFLKVIDRGGFNQASEDLGYSRSALSKIIGSIETSVGFPLVKRTSKGVVLNDEGARIIPYIRQLVKLNENLEEEYAIIKGEESGKIRIGCFPSCAYLMIPDIINGFNKEHPGITIEVIEENDLKMIESWLQQGIIDVGLFSREPYHGYGWVRLLTEPYVALIPDNHTLVSHDMIAIKDLCDYNLILFKDQEGYDQDMVKILDKIVNIENFRYFTNSIYMVMQMVAKHDCVALAPLTFAMEVERTQPLTYRPLDVEVTRDIGFAIKDEQNISPMIKKFHKYVNAIAKELQNK